MKPRGPKHGHPAHVLADVLIVVGYMARRRRNLTSAVAPRPGSADPIPAPREPAARHSRRFYLVLSILALAFLALGIRALLASRLEVPSYPAPRGGLVVLTSVKGMAVDAMMSVDTRGGQVGD